MNSLRKLMVFSLPLIFDVLLLWTLFSFAEAEAENIITVCPTSCAYTTIQAAVDNAEPNDLIVVNSGIYTENIVITKPLRLLGEGYESTIIDGNDLDRVLTIDEDVSVEMTGFTLRRGRAPLDENGNAMGGGVFNKGQLHLMETAVVQSIAEGASGHDKVGDRRYGYGGGIFNGCTESICGSLNLNEVIIMNNLAQGGRGFDAVEDKTAGKGGDGYGGAIYNQCLSELCGWIAMTDTQIIRNLAQGGSGGVDYDGNSGEGGDARGGAIYNGCSLDGCAEVMIKNGILNDNNATGGNAFISVGIGAGGGLYNTGFMTLTSVTLTENEAYSGWPESVPYPDISGDGGAIFTAGYLKITRSAIFNNGSGYGGGIFSAEQSYIAMQNSTISHNHVQHYGGGIYNDGELHLNFVTIGENVAESYYGRVPFSGGGGIYSLGKVYIKNSIIAQNQVSMSPIDNGGPDCSGELTSEGYVLVQDTIDCTISGNSTGNILDRDAFMYPIADNGGSTWTQGLSYASPAIDAADPNDCIETDQRGITRPEDGNGDGTAVCDMGAFEGVIPATEITFLPIIGR